MTANRNDTNGVQFEISIDSVPRTHHDEGKTAIAIALTLKDRNRSSAVKVTDLRDGSTIAEIEWEAAAGRPRKRA